VCVVALVRSFHDRRLKCLTNSATSPAAVLRIAAAITIIWQRRVIAYAQVRLSKCGRTLVQGSRRAAGVAYAPSFHWFAHAGPNAVVLFSNSRKDLLSTRPEGPVGNVAAPIFFPISTAMGNGNWDEAMELRRTLIWGEHRRLVPVPTEMAWSQTWTPEARQ